ncbi:MAG: hypothetical protein LBB62_07535 [Proteiniphilum sp.]|jgi:hypothetical protein|nr:hypothetical protein [Proteiniphilum sp.]
MGKETSKYQANSRDFEVTEYITEGCVIHTVALSSSIDKPKVHISFSYSNDNEYVDIISGKSYEEALNMMIKAVNNRTRERNYFKLYINLLDGSMTDEEFDQEIEVNENNYIVNETEMANLHRVSLALQLSKHIMNVDSINDLSSLFSFNPNSLEQLALEQ